MDAMARPPLRIEVSTASPTIEAAEVVLLLSRMPRPSSCGIRERLERGSEGADP